MARPLTIVVGGYIVAFPLGGMTWHHLNYLLGLHELGHEVWFLEDSGSFALPFDPTTGTCAAESGYGRAYLERTLAEYGLPPRWCYYSEPEGRHYGLSREELGRLLARADLFLAVSGVTPLRPERPRPRRTAVIDTDPVYTQLRMRGDENFLAYYRAFDRAATFGRLVGSERCPLPTHGIAWIPTNQPVALGPWTLARADSRVFTTVGRWQHEGRTQEFGGRTYTSGKAPEWEKLADLPRRVPFGLEVAMQKMPAEPAARFQALGWTISDEVAATRDCAAFQRFVERSAGELTVAKDIYAGVPSGWFSDRSALYLAAGRPVVTQATGFERWLATGEGLFAFETADEAAAALEAIAGDYERHARAARRVAEESFEAKKVLSELLARVID